MGTPTPPFHRARTCWALRSPNPPLCPRLSRGTRGLGSGVGCGRRVAPETRSPQPGAWARPPPPSDFEAERAGRGCGRRGGSLVGSPSVTPRPCSGDGDPFFFLPFFKFPSASLQRVRQNLKKRPPRAGQHMPHPLWVRHQESMTFGIVIGSTWRMSFWVM